MSLTNVRCFLKSRPGADNAPSVDNFGVENCDAPGLPSDGEVTIKSSYLSLDPALRCRMNDDTGVHYMEAWKQGETVLGLGGVGTVIRSNNSEFQEGDLVQSVMNWPWTVLFNAKPDPVTFPLSKVDPALKDKPQLVLSLLGMTGLTSLLGVRERGHLTPGANQTFVVSAAAGACGNLAGQIARLLGAKNVVGICGAANKCDYLTQHLGFDAAINYKTDNVAQRLKETCPDGIHVYFDNVGGELSETVISQMVPGSHVVLCGQIAVYNKDLPYPPPISEQLQQIIKERKIIRERFLVVNFMDKFADGLKQLQQWHAVGKLKIPEVIFEALNCAPEAFVNMMTSVKQDKVGKQMIRVT